MTNFAKPFGQLRSSSLYSKGNPATTWSLMAIGILILLIACINFMNFSMAMIPSRVRGINIQRILNEIRSNPSVINCTRSYELPGKIAQNWGLDLNEKEIEFAAWVIRHDFTSFFGIPIYYQEMVGKFCV